MISVVLPVIFPMCFSLGILGSTLTDLVHQLTSVLEKTIPHLLQKEVT